MPLPSLAAALMLMIPPPVAGDDRTEILESVHSLVDAITSGDYEALDALLESEGSVIAVDTLDPAERRQEVMTFTKLREPDGRDRPVFIERLGIPTVLQRGDIAHVWVPYRFSVSGTLRHCGINAFTLVRRDDRWRTAGIVYTVEATSTCAEVGAPETDG
ncbi:MAG: hypothetical protein ACK4NZ_00975 [Tsuneonella sp.]|jgi:hypothetical protein